MKRPTIKKSTRFAIFARDGFTCRYCGRNTDEVTLVIDHVIPVAKGGTNNEENLATACNDCNAGKGVKSATPDKTNEIMRLSILQSIRESTETAESAVRLVKAIQKSEDCLVKNWCKMTGRTSMHSGTRNVIVSYVSEYGLSSVLQWVAKAAIKCPYSDQSMGKYISGIVRIVRKEQSQESEAAI